MRNISTISLDETARTSQAVAASRAKSLHQKQCSTVIELCVGPSLKVLEKEYSRYGIKTTGNDIDIRWTNFYKKGNWIIGDALELDLTRFDAAVFAPPLTRGCTGRREDSLAISQIHPKYEEFLTKAVDHLPCKYLVLVFHGRVLSLRSDKSYLYKLFNMAYDIGFTNIVERKDAKNKVTKYIDMEIQIS
jgi:hypothetical protein